MTSLQSYSKPYFNYNPTDEKAAEFAQHLITDMGNFSPHDCDLIVNVGGDGTVLWAFHNISDVSPNAPYFALKPPSSRSALHNGHYNIEDGGDLRRALDHATLSTLPVLKAEISLSDGSQQTIHALQDVVLRSFNSQAMLPEIKIDGEVKENDMNCGVIIATPMGSTAINETFGGHMLNFEDSSVAMTLIGITNPRIRSQLRAEGRLSRTLPSQSCIDVPVSPTGAKRLTSIDFDNQTMMPDGQIFDPSRPITIDTTLRHIQHIAISVDPSQTRQILFSPEYRTPNPYENNAYV